MLSQRSLHLLSLALTLWLINTLEFEHALLQQIFNSLGGEDKLLNFYIPARGVDKKVRSLKPDAARVSTYNFYPWAKLPLTWETSVLLKYIFSCQPPMTPSSSL